MGHDAVFGRMESTWHWSELVDSVWVCLYRLRVQTMGILVIEATEYLTCLSSCACDTAVLFIFN